MPLSFLILLVGLQIIQSLLLLLLLFFFDRILIVHSSPNLSSLESLFICKEQKCNSIEYKQYLSFVSLEYRICDECEVELDCYHRFGKLFSFRTINSKNYLQSLRKWSGVFVCSLSESSFSLSIIDSCSVSSYRDSY